MFLMIMVLFLLFLVLIMPMLMCLRVAIGNRDAVGSADSLLEPCHVAAVSYQAVVTEEAPPDERHVNEIPGVEVSCIVTTKAREHATTTNF